MDFSHRFENNYIGPLHPSKKVGLKSSISHYFKKQYEEIDNAIKKRLDLLFTHSVIEAACNFSISANQIIEDVLKTLAILKILAAGGNQ